MLRILHVVGARPNLIKVAPVMEALTRSGIFEQRLVHTGQHYDQSLSQVFFDQLSIPRPDINLEVGSASQALQTARIMIAFEPVCFEWKPDLVVVVGDVNSTVACALVAAKLGVKVAHVEAGLRSFDRTMPEEINRVVTDRLSDLLFTTEPAANENLRREGIPAERIHFVGNVMIDTLLRHREHARALAVPQRMGLAPASYVLVTLHRPSNVDTFDALRPILSALRRVAETHPVVFPMHPRTRQRVKEHGLMETLHGVRVTEPLGYLDFLGLMAEAGVVLTDSGGVQEETTALGVPCLTLRRNTERPVTIEQGTNRLVRLEPGAIVRDTLEVMDARRDGYEPPGALPELWDGRAAERIARIIAAALRMHE